MVLMMLSPSCYANCLVMARLLEQYAPHVRLDFARYSELAFKGGKIVMPSAESARELTHKLIWEARYNAGILLEQIGEL